MVTDQTVIQQDAIWSLLLVFLEYDQTYSIVEHRRNLTPAVSFGFLYDEKFAKDVLFKLPTFNRAQLLRDCSTVFNANELNHKKVVGQDRKLKRL